MRLESGALAYLTRRMDREDGVKHMLDCCQLTNRQTERKCSCYLIGNSDMHLKNFSLIREHDGSWHLSRAYDLVPVKTVTPADADELALTLNGKNRNLRAAWGFPQGGGADALYARSARADAEARDEGVVRASGRSA